MVLRGTGSTLMVQESANYFEWKKMEQPQNFIWKTGQSDFVVDETKLFLGGQNSDVWDSEKFFK